MALEFGAFRDEITKYDTFRYMGKIEKIVGMTIEASGPACNIGDVCRIYSKDMTSFIRAEVVGFNKSNILLMPYTEIEGIGPGSIVDSPPCLLAARRRSRREHPPPALRAAFRTGAQRSG